LRFSFAIGLPQESIDQVGHSGGLGIIYVWLQLVGCIFPVIAGATRTYRTFPLYQIIHNFSGGITYLNSALLYSCSGVGSKELFADTSDKFWLMSIVYYLVATLET